MISIRPAKHRPDLDSGQDVKSNSLFAKKRTVDIQILYQGTVEMICFVVDFTSTGISLEILQRVYIGKNEREIVSTSTHRINGKEKATLTLNFNI